MVAVYTLKALCYVSENKKKKSIQNWKEYNRGSKHLGYEGCTSVTDI